MLVFSKRLNDLLRRQTSWTPGVEMENIEDMPMTGGTDGRDDTENRHAV